MPQPLPWFDNNIDSTLPSEQGYEIKPLLYYFDEYQTYDLISWSRNANKFKFSVKYLANVTFTNTGVKHLLIERFTPWYYPWCEDYSAVIYDFLNEYSGTDYYDWVPFTLRNEPFLGLYNLSVLNLVFGTENPIFDSIYDNSSSVELELPVTDKLEIISITWLEKENNFKVTELKKKYILLETSTKEKKYINLDISNLVHCTLVVSTNNEDTINFLESQFTQGCLYKNLTKMILYIKGVINNAFPRLFRVVDYIVFSVNLNIFYQSPNFNWRLEGGIFSPSAVVTSAVFRERPSYYRSCSLLYANNNYWKNGNEKEDLGKIPKFISKSQAPFFEYFLLEPYIKHNIDSLSLSDNGGVKITNLPIPLDDYANDDFNFYLYVDKYLNVTGRMGYIWNSEPNGNMYYSSLLNQISGTKIFNIAIFAVDQGNFTDSSITNVKYYLMDNEIEIGTNGTATATQSQPKLIGEKTHPYHRPINPLPEHYFTYQETRQKEQTIQYHYFLDDSEWNSNNEIVFGLSRNPVPTTIKGNWITVKKDLIIKALKLSNQEVIKLIDAHIYSNNAASFGEFNANLNE